MSAVLLVSIFTLFGILAIVSSTTISTSYSTAVCGGRAHEFYSYCASLCQPTCTNRRPATCISSCRAQCVCSSGYVRDMRRTNCPCVLPQQCSSSNPTCPVNEQYSTCGTACQATCTNRNPACIRNCVSGCFCRSGYVRNSRNVCVLPQNCQAAQSKAGRCPPIPIVTGTSITYCNNDFNCPGTQKCCSQSPGGRKICSAVVQAGK